MSGKMYWYGDGTGYAAETDPGTVKIDHGGSTTDPTEYTAGSAQEWGWHCGWGEERIPLELPGFAVQVTVGDSYEVTLTPAMGPVLNQTTGVTYGTIQLAIDAAGQGHTIIASAGTYDEQVVIDKSLTLQGVGDNTVIQPSGASTLTTVKTTPWLSGGTKKMVAIIWVDSPSGTVTVKDLKIDGSGIGELPDGVGGGDWVSGLAYLDHSGTIESLTVIGNPDLGCRTCGIWASATSSTSMVEVTECIVEGYNRAGIYALGSDLTANYNHNEINGPGAHTAQVPNGMFFLEGATGSATYNTVTDLGYTGEIYRSTGIGTYNAGTDITFAYNTISNVQNAFALSTGTSGTIVEYNNIFNNHTGVRIEAGATNSIIQYNNIHDNDFAIRCGPEMGDSNEAHYNNFVDNPGLEWTNVEGGVPYTYVGAVCNLHETYTLDATNNWWGHASGPGGSCGRINSSGKCVGKGDCIEGDVIFDPWLRNAIEKLKEPKK